MPIRVPPGASPVEVRQALQQMSHDYFDESSDVDHDETTNFVANEHIDHTGVTLAAGAGLTGGGDISASRTFALSHLGIEALVDPDADRIAFWDDSASAVKWLSLGTNLAITDTTLDATGITDHGALTGLTDTEDHPDYFLCDGTRTLGGAYTFEPSSGYDFRFDHNTLYSSGRRGLAIQLQTSGKAAFLDWHSKDGDTTDDVGITLWPKGTPDSLTNREYFEFRWDHSNAECAINNGGSGSYTNRPINIYTEGNRGQILLATDGTVSIGSDLAVTGNITGGNLTSGADPGHTHSIYLAADGSVSLTGNLSVDAAVTIDGRDVSADGSKLDGIEAGADVTDAANVAAAGAAMSGGAFHDGFSDFVANEHIDWTSAASAFHTSSTGQFDSYVGIGNAPSSAFQLYVKRAQYDTDNLYGLYVKLSGGANSATGEYDMTVMTFELDTLCDNGYSNTGYAKAIAGEALTASVATGTTLTGLIGADISIGANTGMAGTITNAYGLRLLPYDRAGTVTNLYSIFISGAALTGGGTVTNKYSIYDDTGWNWRIAADNQKIQLGASAGDFALYSDGTNACLSSAADIILSPGGNVRFGTYSAIGAETVTGYITFKDSAGNSRKMAILS